MKTAPIVKMKLNMNVTRISSVAAMIRSVVGSQGRPSHGTASSRWKPQPLKPITTTVRIATAISRRRRDASRSVSRTMIRIGATGPSEQLQESVLERLLPRLDGVHLAAQPHDRRDQPRHLGRRDPADR